MPLIIGMDEAGYGPNFGPLVITATVWEVPGDPRRCDLWKACSAAVTNAPERNESRLHIADSKQVYSTERGLGGLELGVHSALALGAGPMEAFRSLWEHLDPASASQAHTEPWFAGDDLNLPTTACRAEIQRKAAAWGECCDQAGITLRGVYSDVVLTQRFNDETRRQGSKGQALSQLSLRLLARAWSPVDDSPALVIADKHGGRNRYQDLLPTAVQDEFILCLEESRASSRYRVRESEIRFETRAERYLPVALASMFSKYVRELAMQQFNRFWRGHLPDIVPTAGYPNDAVRFRAEIAATVAALGIPDDSLWRCR